MSYSKKCIIIADEFKLYTIQLLPVNKLFLVISAILTIQQSPFNYKEF